MNKPQFTIGGSEIGTILGFNPYETPIELFARKLGLLEREPENESMRWGKEAEHVVARRYARETGKTLYPSTDMGFDYKMPFIHPKYPWWRGTPDRHILPDGVLEIKIIGERTAHLWGDPPDGDVPDMYLLQCHYYMPLLKATYADLAVQIGNRDYRVFRINYDPEMEDLIARTAEEFINNHLIPQIPPSIDASEGARRYLHSRYPKEEDDLLLAPAEAQEWLEARARAVDLLSEAETGKTLADNKLKEIIGGHLGINGFGYKATWKKNKDGEKTDWEAAFKELAAEHAPEIRDGIIKNHTKKIIGPRVLRVIPTK